MRQNATPESENQFGLLANRIVSALSNRCAFHSESPLMILRPSHTGSVRRCRFSQLICGVMTRELKQRSSVISVRPQAASRSPWSHRHQRPDEAKRLGFPNRRGRLEPWVGDRAKSPLTFAGRRFARFGRRAEWFDGEAFSARARRGGTTAFDDKLDSCVSR